MWNNFFLRFIFNLRFFQIVLAVTLLAFVGWIFFDFFLTFLITFLFSYLFLDAAHTVHRRVHLGLDTYANPTLRRDIRPYVTVNIIVTLIYIIFVCVITIILSLFLPKLVNEGASLAQNIPAITTQVQAEIASISSIANVDLGLDTAIANFLDRENLQNLVTNTLENLKNAGIFVIQLVASLILSYIFIIDRDKIRTYLQGVEHSNFAFLYYEYERIFTKVQKGFGLIFKAQSIVALADSVMTFFGLFIIAFVYSGNAFPYMLTLSVLVFIFGFIPVLGLFMSSAPILIIAYTFGGVPVLIATTILVAIIHFIDAYVLSPKIVSSFMDFPIFVSFIVLLVSEHLFGFIGLLIGIPIYYIIIDVLRDFNVFLGKVKIAHKEYTKLKDDTRLSLTDGIRLSRSGKRGPTDATTP